MYHVHVYNLQLTRLQACKEISTFRFSDKKKGVGGYFGKIGYSDVVGV